jgi:hypothetical protein
MILNRRVFFGLLATPAIVKASSLMPISAPKPAILVGEVGRYEGVRFVEYGNMVPFTLDRVRDIARIMEERNIAPIDGYYRVVMDGMAARAFR